MLAQCSAPRHAQRRRGGVEGTEDHLADRIHPQLLQTMTGHVEIGRVTALAAQALAEGHADQFAGRVIGPLVVHTGMRTVLADVAAQLAAHQCAAMRAAVDPTVQRVGGIPRQHDGRVANEGGLVITRGRHLGGQAQKAPHRPAENSLLLLGVEGLVLIHPVRSARLVGRRPAQGVSTDSGAFKGTPPGACLLCVGAEQCAHIWRLTIPGNISLHPRVSCMELSYASARS